MKGVCFVNASSTNLKYVTEAVCSSFVFSSVILFSMLWKLLFWLHNLWTIVQWGFRRRLRLPSHFAGEIWKRSFVVSTVRPTVHTNPSQKQSFSKTLFKSEEFQNAGFSFSWGWKTFWKHGFLKTMTSRWSRDFPARVFLKRKSKMAGDCRVF